MKYTQEKQEQGKELVEKLITKAWESASFKSELVSNPKAAIEALTNSEMSIPEGKTIVVEDQTDADVIYINIPAKVDVDDFELSEEQLEKVSGGAACGGACIFGVVVAAVQVLDWLGEGWNNYE